MVSTWLWCRGGRQGRGVLPWPGGARCQRGCGPSRIQNGARRNGCGLARLLAYKLLISNQYGFSRLPIYRHMSSFVVKCRRSPPYRRGAPMRTFREEMAAAGRAVKRCFSVSSRAAGARAVSRALPLDRPCPRRPPGAALADMAFSPCRGFLLCRCNLSGAAARQQRAFRPPRAYLAVGRYPDDTPPRPDVIPG